MSDILFEIKAMCSHYQTLKDAELLLEVRRAQAGRWQVRHVAALPRHLHPAASRA